MATTSRDASSEERRVRVWDLPVRLFHWSIAALVIAAFLTSGNNDVHPYVGFAILALVGFRILWGLIGSETARFSSFVRGPAVVVEYARGILSRRAEFHLGHNPLGGWVIVVMLVLLLVQGALGLFTTDDILFEGPLAHLVSGDVQSLATHLHRFIGTLLMWLVALHVGAAFYYLLYKRVDLISPMLTGMRALPPNVPHSEPAGRSVWLAAVILAVCVGIVYSVVA